MERGGDRHHTADGSDPKPPSPAVAKNVDCGLECGFPSVHSLLGGSMPSAARGDTREQDATTFSAGISQDAKSPHPTSAGKMLKLRRRRRRALARTGWFRFPLQDFRPVTR